ncbi:high mobility group box domain-containing protein [Circinella umbellata]|nr:high mobility group box domain-containing protein [Circinella umbellata]
MAIATIASSSTSSQQEQQQQSNDSATDQYQIKAFLASCNLSQYYNVMIQEGFEQLEALFEVTEIDLEQMGVKRGHRRLLQRAIANSKRKSAISPLILNNNHSNNNFTRDPSILLTSPKSHPSFTGGNLSHHASVSSMSLGGSTQTSSSNDEDMVTSENINKIWKRRYRRRARIDHNAPKKPPSAYVMFSNDIRMELKEQNLSFTTLSKITGDRWKNLEPNERKFYEVKADYAKDDYILAQAKYQLTDEHKQYQQYLSEFRMRHASSGKKKIVYFPRNVELKMLTNYLPLPPIFLIN